MGLALKSKAPSSRGPTADSPGGAHSRRDLDGAAVTHYKDSHVTFLCIGYFKGSTHQMPKPALGSSQQSVLKYLVVPWPH